MTYDQALDFITNRPDIAFSGWAIPVVISLIAATKYTIKLLRTRFSKQKPALETPKHPLSIPKFSIHQSALSFTGGLNPVKDYTFKITNNGGTAYNCLVYVGYLNAKVDLNDLTRNSSKFFTLKFGEFDLPQILQFKLTFKDSDGDDTTAYLDMNLIRNDYRPA